MTKTISQEWEEVSDKAKKATEDILTTVLASLDKNNDIEQAVIYAVTKHIKSNHGFLEATPFIPYPYEEKARLAMERVGDDYNPFLTKAYAIRYVDKD